MRRKLRNRLVIAIEETDLIEDLKRHESVMYEVYADSLHGASYTSLGVSHRIKPSEKYYGEPIGTQVSEEDVQFYLIFWNGFWRIIF